MAPTDERKHELDDGEDGEPDPAECGRHQVLVRVGVRDGGALQHQDQGVVRHPCDEAEAGQAKHQARLPNGVGDSDDARADDGVDVIAGRLRIFEGKFGACLNELSQTATS